MDCKWLLEISHQRYLLNKIDTDKIYCTIQRYLQLWHYNITSHSLKPIIEHLRLYVNVHMKFFPYSSPGLAVLSTVFLQNDHSFFPSTHFNYDKFHNISEAFCQCWAISHLNVPNFA